MPAGILPNRLGTSIGIAVCTLVQASVVYTHINTGSTAAPRPLAPVTGGLYGNARDFRNEVGIDAAGPGNTVSSEIHCFTAGIHRNAVGFRHITYKAAAGVHLV